MCCSTPGSLYITISQRLFKLMSIELVMPSNHLILCCPLLLLLSIFLSIRIFSNESVLYIRWPKYWSFSIRRTDFLQDWLVWSPYSPRDSQDSQDTLLQHHRSKASILWSSAFLMVQFSHPYMSTGKTIALAIWTFAGKVMSRLFNMLSMLVITFLPRNKSLLISWLQSLSAVILEPKKIKSLTVSILSLSICHEVMGIEVMIFDFLMLSFKPDFSPSCFIFIKRLFVPLHFFPKGWCHLHIWGYWYFSQQSWFQLSLHPARHLHDVLCI